MTTTLPAVPGATASGAAVAPVPRDQAAFAALLLALLGLSLPAVLLGHWAARGASDYAHRTSRWALALGYAGCVVWAAALVVCAVTVLHAWSSLVSTVVPAAL